MNAQQQQMLRLNIKKYRKKLNITQEMLAERLNYTKQAISNWETGKNLPSDEDIEKMAEIFGIEPHALITRSTDKNNNIPDLEFLEILPIPNRVFTYAIFFKNNINTQWQAWIYDMDYPAMIFSGYSCSIHDNYASFKEDFLKDIDEAIEIARDFMDERDVDDYAKEMRSTKNMLEAMEAFADNPEAFKLDE